MAACLSRPRTRGRPRPPFQQPQYAQPQYQQPQYQQPAQHPAGPVKVQGLTGGQIWWAMACHLCTFVLLGLIGPIVIYVVYKDKCHFVAKHALEALNFHLTILVAAAVGMAVSLALSLVLIGAVVGMAFFAFLGIWVIVIPIVAAVKAYGGEYYHPPLTFKFFN